VAGGATDFPAVLCFPEVDTPDLSGAGAADEAAPVSTSSCLVRLRDVILGGILWEEGMSTHVVRSSNFDQKPAKNGQKRMQKKLSYLHLP